MKQHFLLYLSRRRERVCHGPQSYSSAVSTLWDRAAQSLAASGTPTTSDNGGILV